jgi:hypothetical protein
MSYSVVNDLAKAMKALDGKKKRQARSEMMLMQEKTT